MATCIKQQDNLLTKVTKAQVVAKRESLRGLARSKNVVIKSGCVFLASTLQKTQI
jgi:hypothetical protein